MNQKFKGIYVAAITPFKKDASFDMEAAKRHLDWLIESGVAGVCVLGATGEYQSVTNAEHRQYVQEIVSYIKDRTSVLVGVSRERPDDVIELMEHAFSCGADAGMLLSPFYCHPNQEEILENYRYIASKTSLPIVVYNNPGSAGVDIDRECLTEIMQLPQVQVVKESTGDIHRLTEAVIDAPVHTSIFCGCDSLAMESFAMGAVGWISMAANFAPKDCCALLKAVQANNLEAAFEIYKQLLPVLNLLEGSEKPAATIKYILSRYRNLTSGFMRRPQLDLTETEKTLVDCVADFNSLH